MNKTTPEQYVKALMEVNRSCCSIPGAEPKCSYCPNYKIIINQIGRNVMNQQINGYGNPQKDWEYLPIWQELVSLSDHLDEVDLFVCQQESLKESDLQKVILELQAIVSETSLFLNHLWRIKELLKQDKTNLVA